MLLWEIDRSLNELTQLYGFERASRAYTASLHAVAALKSLVLQLGLRCDMRNKDSLYLAAGSTSKELIEEHQLRRRAGLPGDFLDHAMLLDTVIARQAAVVTTAELAAAVAHAGVSSRARGGASSRSARTSRSSRARGHSPRTRWTGPVRWISSGHCRSASTPRGTTRPPPIS